MKKAKAPRVPVLEQAFEVNLPKLMRAAKATGSSRLVLDDGDVRTVVLLMGTRLATFLGGRTWIVDIVPVQCLKNRVRPLLKCTRAHEGNFQSLYFRNNELACRLCHELRYRTSLASCATERTRLKRDKLFMSFNGCLNEEFKRKPYSWRRRHIALCSQLLNLSGSYYDKVLKKSPR